MISLQLVVSISVCLYLSTPWPFSFLWLLRVTGIIDWLQSLILNKANSLACVLASRLFALLSSVGLYGPMVKTQCVVNIPTVCPSREVEIATLAGPFFFFDVVVE